MLLDTCRVPSARMATGFVPAVCGHLGYLLCSVRSELGRQLLLADPLRSLLPVRGPLSASR